MKYLVTGGAGFIGSHLTEELLKEGHEVIVVDNLSEGSRDNLPLDNPNLKFYEDDIMEVIMWEHLFKDVDVVFHLAAITRPQESIDDPKIYNRVNVEGTLNVLIAARDMGVKRVVFASSASIYGEQYIYPCLETATPNSMSPYGLQKFMGELYCKLFTDIYGLETNCLRFFNVYGTRMNPDSPYSALIPKFIKKIKAGEQPTIFGHGNQARDFCHIDDVVRAIILASKIDGFGQVFNVGGGVNYSVNDVFEIICNKLGKTMTPLHGPAVIEPTQTLADITKARDILAWSPEVSLEEGVRRLVEQGL